MLFGTHKIIYLNLEHGDTVFRFKKKRATLSFKLKYGVLVHFSAMPLFGISRAGFVVFCDESSVIWISLFCGTFFGLYDYFIRCIFAHKFDNRCHHLVLSQNTV